MLESRRTYKLRAEELMTGKHLQVLFIYLIFGLTMFLLGYIANIFRPIIWYEWQTGSYAIIEEGNIRIFSILFFFGIFLTISFEYVIMKMYWDVARNIKPPLAATLVSGMYRNPFRNIFVFLFRWVILSVWFIFLIIPVFVKTYAYSMCYYLRIREPKLSAGRIIGLSDELTEGYKWRLFALDLSYIGWYLLCILSLGILFVWVVPRHHTTRMLYFNAIYNQAVFTNKQMNNVDEALKE